ncbi:MAG: xanthine dehydrogenase family protein molybdopterin-binding subunit [Candidatus Tectomicrobia bacterium]|nr:xanthine dehydrogenase family protein molybdopterin-binding subunit [Candidatus Tectomicrobia bacterium]
MAKRAVPVAPGTWVGRSVPRVEDKRLLTGRGQYTDDIKLPGMCHAAVLRSPYPHAAVRSIDASSALGMPGVRGVLTGEDVRRMSRPFPQAVDEPLEYYCLAVDRARYVGEGVAVVVAENRYLAEDAFRAIRVEYEALPAVVDVEKAAEEGAPLLHPKVGTNVINHRALRYGDPDAAFAGADVTVGERFFFPKYSSTPMETFAVIAQHDPAEDVITIWSNFQGPFTMHPVSAAALQIPENRLRFIVPPDIGGGFGIKSSMFPQMVMTALAAKKTGVPVKYIEDRMEHLMSSSSGTDRVTYIEAAAQRDGTLLGIRKRVMDNVGAYLRSPEPACMYRTTGNQLGPYDIPHLAWDAYVVMTNKSPTGPNRGYGCQQLYFEMERIVDLLADRLGMDPAEIRRKNLVRKDRFPYVTATGGIYDAGDYGACLDLALQKAGYAALRQEQEEARKEGRLFGIGLSTVVDPSVTNIAYITVAYTPEFRASGRFNPKSGSGETAVVKMDPLGQVSVIINTVPEGQGHETVVSQIVADELGVAPGDVRVVSGIDTFTRFWSITTGTYSSRFASVGASAVAMAARKVREKLFQIAAHHFEVDAKDLELADGAIRVKGAPERKISIRRAAGIAHWNQGDLPEGMEPGVQATYTYNFPTSKAPDDKDRVDSSATYGFIADLACVEIDPDTGQVEIRKYVTVHDCGKVLNPTLVEGQIYGSFVHGLGGALYEEMAYDESGQYLAGSFIDYLCPTAAEVPVLDIGHIEIPSPVTVLGSKGCGESCTMSVPACLANAVADALKPLGAAVTRLPLRPSDVWQLIQDAKGGGAPPGEKRA